MAGIAILAVCLAAIKGAYHPRLYGETAVIKVMPSADRTPEVMAAHARRSVGPEVLGAASLDPRLSALHRPLFVADPDKPMHSMPVPQIYAHVDSVEDGTIRIDSVSGGSAGEASAVAVAVADAYIKDQGPGRVVSWSAGIPLSSRIVPKPLGRAWELATAVVLSVLASAMIFIIPGGGPMKMGDET